MYSSVSLKEKYSPALTCKFVGGGRIVDASRQKKTWQNIASAESWPS